MNTSLNKEQFSNDIIEIHNKLEQYWSIFRKAVENEEDNIYNTQDNKDFDFRLNLLKDVSNELITYITQSE